MRQDDTEHLMSCQICGQPMDLRDLGVVLAHEAPHTTWLDPQGQPIVGTLGKRIS